MDELLKTLVGKAFIHPVTRVGYGPIRLAPPSSKFSTLDGRCYAAFADDPCGNSFTSLADGSIHFWDHETDELVFLASSMEVFAVHCVDPEEVTVDERSIISVWVDPAFAKAQGITTPADGWIKKPDSHGLKKGSKPN